MKIDRVLELLKIERECVTRQSPCNKKSKLCDRNCGECDIAQNDLESIEMYDFVISMVEMLKEQPKWEKASKKLPTDRDWYLGIFQEADTGWINPIPFICDYVGKLTRATTKEGWIIRHCTDREFDDSGGYYYNLKCVAWMPLPEPPKEEKQ